jgi:hypothetical protein
MAKTLVSLRVQHAPVCSWGPGGSVGGNWVPQQQWWQAASPIGSESPGKDKGGDGPAFAAPPQRLGALALALHYC